MYIAGKVTQEEINNLLVPDAASLGLRLMGLFFSEVEMANGICTCAPGRAQLDQDILRGIRRKYMYVIQRFKSLCIKVSL